VRDSAITLKKSLVLSAFILAYLILAPITLTARFLIPSGEYVVSPAKPAQETTLRGKSWAYTVPFRVENASTIEKLIQCESQGVNIARPDSNGLISWGILQFNGTSTWAEMSRRFDFHGSPLQPADAIHMADLMIEAGLVYRWTCARIVL
jgi:hypothetical protein